MKRWLGLGRGGEGVECGALYINVPSPLAFSSLQTQAKKKVININSMVDVAAGGGSRGASYTRYLHVPNAAGRESSKSVMEKCRERRRRKMMMRKNAALAAADARSPDPANGGAGAAAEAPQQEAGSGVVMGFPVAPLAGFPWASSGGMQQGVPIPPVMPPLRRR